MKRVTLASLIHKGSLAWKKKQYADAARFFSAVNSEEYSFYTLFMETIAHYMAGNLSAFRNKYQFLLEQFKENFFTAELKAFILFKSEPLDQVLDTWVILLDEFPQAKKIARLIHGLKKNKNVDTWRRHARLVDYITLPDKKYLAQSMEKSYENNVKKNNSPGKQSIRAWMDLLRNAFVITGLIVLLFFSIHSAKLLIEGGAGKWLVFWTAKWKFFSAKENSSSQSNIKSIKKDKNLEKIENVSNSSSRDAKHIDSLLGEHPDALHPDALKSEKKPPLLLDAQAVNNRYTQARELLRKGERNNSLIMINETMQSTLSLHDEQRFKTLKGIARSFQNKQDKSVLSFEQVFKQPRLYDECTVQWQGRLDRIVNDGHASHLLININSESLPEKAFIVFFPQTVGKSRIGSQVRIHGRIRSEADTPFFKEKRFILEADVLDFIDKE